MLFVLGGTGTSSGSGIRSTTSNNSSTTLDLSALLGKSAEEQHGRKPTGALGPGKWQLTVQYVPGGETALLRNMSEVRREVSEIPPNGVVTVPPYSIATVNRLQR